MSLIAATPGGSAQSLSGNILGDGIIAASLVGQQDNLAPDGIQGATLVSLRLSAALSITGTLAAPANVFRWFKNDSPYVATLIDQSAASAAANRFNLYGANLSLPAGATAGFIYNGLTARWDLFTVSGNSAGPAPGALVTFGPETTFVLAAGGNNNVTPVPAVASINRLFLDASAGNAVVTGIAAGANGQALLVTLNSANEVELPNEDAGSLAVNRLFGVGPTLIQRGSALLVYSGTLSRWVVG